MFELYWNPAGLTYFAELVMITIITIYFLFQCYLEYNLNERVRPTAVLLLLSFGGVALNVFFNVLRETLPMDTAMFVLPLVSPPMAIAAAAFMQFAYRFPSSDLFSKRERRIVLVVCGLFVCAEVVVAFFRFMYLAEGLIEYRPKYLDGAFILTGLWTTIIFLRQYYANLQSNQTNMRVVISGLFFGALHSKPARAARAFVWFCILLIGLAIVRYFHGQGWISPILSEVLTSLLTLIFTTALALLYLNYIPERSSFMIKLVGVTLTTVLAVLGIMSWLISPIYADAYINPSMAKEETSILFAPDGQDGYNITSSPYQYEENIGKKLEATLEPIAFPFTFPFYEQNYESIWVREDGFTGFNQWPWWRDLNLRSGPQPALIPLAVELGGFKYDNLHEGSGVFIDANADRFLVSWINLPSTYHPSETYTFQMALYPTGMIIFSYKDIPDIIHHDIFNANQPPFSMGITPGHKHGSVHYVNYDSEIPISGEPNAGYIENYRQDFLTYLDRIYSPIAWFMLGVSIFIVVIFPAFFQINLVRPLKTLMQGIREFKDGNFDRTLKVSYNDEIGYLTDSFTDMANAQNDLINTLEFRVRERSAVAADLAAENARLEERNRISSDLHDAVSQTLFSSVMLSETLTKMNPDDTELVQTMLGDIRQLNQNALSEMRMLLMELRPKSLTEKTMKQLLKQLCQAFETRNDINISLDVTEHGDLPESVKITFFRIAQESLSNISKHAQADTVSILFDSAGKQALLVVEDNGIGFDPNDIPIGHWGLDIMEKRLSDIGGSLEVDSTRNEVTRVTALWMVEGDE